jgi:NAD(P)-dependent dehydrogenase (short-subunit alcohol dehydrogenase family)
MKTAIITGHTSGLGKEIARELKAQGQWNIIGWSHETGVDVRKRDDIVKALFDAQDRGFEQLDLLVNCAGINYINWHEETPEAWWDQIMDTNAKSMWLITKLMLEKSYFKSPATIVNIVSNASHIPMTHSSAYNASKGAAHILTLQMARELKKRHNITVFGVSPNKMHSTQMTEYINERVCELRGWTREEAQRYQLQALPAGMETDPAACAEFIAFLLSTTHRHQYLNGCVLPYGA